MRDVPAFSELLKLREAPAIVCVDMPIGLHEHAPPGGRECESLARGLLGPRRSSVFSALGRQTLACLNQADAHATSVAGGGIGIGAQAWGLAAKLREVDGAMSTARQTASVRGASRTVLLGDEPTRAHAACQENRRWRE